MDKAQEICEYLNELIQKDESAVRRLLQTHVLCNESLSKDEFAPVWWLRQPYGTSPQSFYFFSSLGLLNGVLAKLGIGLIHTVTDDETGSILRFEPH